MYRHLHQGASAIPGNQAWPRNATLRVPKGRNNGDQSLNPGATLLPGSAERQRGWQPWIGQVGRSKPSRRCLIRGVAAAAIAGAEGLLEACALP